MKINEVENFPKALLKKKTVPLYKATFISRSRLDERYCSEGVAAVMKVAAAFLN